jgi:sugar diacid utilization regulator
MKNEQLSQQQQQQEEFTQDVLRNSENTKSAGTTADKTR